MFPPPNSPLPHCGSPISTQPKSTDNNYRIIYAESASRAQSNISSSRKEVARLPSAAAAGRKTSSQCHTFPNKTHIELFTLPFFFLVRFPKDRVDGNTRPLAFSFMLDLEIFQFPRSFRLHLSKNCCRGGDEERRRKWKPSSKVLLFLFVCSQSRKPV